VRALKHKVKEDGLMAIVLKRDSSLNQEVRLCNEKSASINEEKKLAISEFNKKIVNWFLRLDWLSKTLLIIVFIMLLVFTSGIILLVLGLIWIFFVINISSPYYRRIRAIRNEYASSIKGNVGETMVSDYLENHLPGDYYLINDLVITEIAFPVFSNSIS